MSLSETLHDQCSRQRGKLEWNFAEQSTMEQFQKHLEKVDGGEELLKKVTMKVTKYAPE